MAEPTVMLIDDDEQFVYLIRRYAQISGLELINVGINDNVLAAIGQHPPDIIFLEAALHMHNDNATLQMLRKSATTRYIPVILFSSIDIDAVQYDESADGYLLKPILYADFLHVLHQMGVAQTLPV